MVDHLANREKIIRNLKQELVGPSPQGDEIDCSGEVVFEEKAAFYRPWKQKGTGEEILQRDPPTVRYGIGVIYPLEIGSREEDSHGTVDSDSEEDTSSKPYTEDGSVTESQVAKYMHGGTEANESSDEVESDDYELTMANTFRPSSMGISFVAELPKDSVLVAEALGGRYKKKQVLVEEKEHTWWLRKSVALSAEFDGDQICSMQRTVVPARLVEDQNKEDLKLTIEVYSRPQGNRISLLTVCLVNRTRNVSAEEYSLFQSSLNITIRSHNGVSHILPYPRAPYGVFDHEEQVLDLLYRHSETFAVGHGAAAGWIREKDTNRAEVVTAESLPVFEVPSITPDVLRDDGTQLEVSMAALAGLRPEDDSFASLFEIVKLYEKWIVQRREDIGSLEKSFRSVAGNNMEECAKCARRMRRGLEYLQQDRSAKRAFQLANYAMLLQQINSNRKERKATYNATVRRLEFSDYPLIDPLSPPEGRGMWRPFQIAFILSCLRSLAMSDDPDRKTVELLWFPTGGGKTEAYLGLAAFSILLRRLKDQSDKGIDVLMRYTLRLLTAQQFQRASGLICALEYLRRLNPDELGRDEFSIGIWLGASTTPNTCENARKALRQLERRGGKNPFLIRRCPWCGAPMGEYRLSVPRGTRLPRVYGYTESGNTVVFKCPDAKCHFQDRLPSYVIDDDIYEKRPSLVIGTVDKFAMLAWRPKVRALFGINEDGIRINSPPGLIIQDELHLISGPLGSMVGLYETLVEELCTDRRGNTPVIPKLVCSTATTRRYADQINGLYRRNDFALFPIAGLEVGESFFASIAKDQDGTRLPGTIYVGVHAPGHRSMQTTQVRTFTALLQAPVSLEKEERDPWWTLLLFFNSLRELGTTRSLFQSDIPDYMRVLTNREGLNRDEVRRFENILELTGRIPSEQVPDAISKLEIPTTSKDKQPIDACLSSSIIEVGIDIDRLSIMAVVGQPKTTCQYIQVTGRIGRRWWERPGFVVTLYSTSRPRDRSHFEKFRSYHERLYSQVEPTSVTPFSLSVLERALHAIIVGYTRQTGNRQQAESPYPFPAESIERFKSILTNCTSGIDSQEKEDTQKIFELRAKQWQNWKRTQWRTSGLHNEIPLLREAGTYASGEQSRLSWPTPTSMRNVDAECKAQISTLYATEGDGDLE